MNILNFLLMNWDSVLFVLAVIVIVIVLICRGETAILKEILFRLVTEAEKEYGSGTGELKKAAVIDWLYDKLPAIVKIFLTPDRLGKLIEEVLEIAKEKWAANPSLQQYITGNVPQPLLPAAEPGEQTTKNTDTQG